MKRYKFRAWYKPDFNTPDGPLKFEQKEIDGELFFAHDDELKYPFEIPFLDDDWIVEQYTEVNDIDGGEIYEGDILQKGELNFDVYWYESKWQARCPNYHKFHWPRFEHFHRECGISEIVGNIHENSDLIKYKE